MMTSRVVPGDAPYQTSTLTRYPAPTSVTAFSLLFGAVMVSLLGLLTVPRGARWLLTWQQFGAAFYGVNPLVAPARALALAWLLTWQEWRLWRCAGGSGVRPQLLPASVGCEEGGARPRGSVHPAAGAGRGAALLLSSGEPRACGKVIVPIASSHFFCDVGWEGDQICDTVFLSPFDRSFVKLLS